MSVDIDDDKRIKGKVWFSQRVPYSLLPAGPGVMGPFAFIPLLECRHEVITVKSRLSGEIEVGGEKIDFDGGLGYVEKDWGSVFPRIYLWAQASAFKNSDASFMLSAAKVPVMGAGLNGLIAFLYAGGRFFRFSTYALAKVKKIEFQNKNEIALEVSSPKYDLAVKLRQNEACALKAPDRTGMNREIKETVSGYLSVKMTRRGGRVEFSDESDCAGIEVCGQISGLV
jgi:tocopherol cyclase